MPILADSNTLTAEGWVLIIGAIFFGIQQVLKMILDHREARRQQMRDEKMTEKLSETSAKQDVIKDKVEEVHKATTNGTSHEDK